jgi:site-specific DNA-methyltransferase (adenine-specific)
VHPRPSGAPVAVKPGRSFEFGKQRLFEVDCLHWLSAAEPDSIHAVVTDPPYGLVEFLPEQQEKLRAGRGGVWRIPPSFDGAHRRALPRFTVLSSEQRNAIFEFFIEFGTALIRVLRPGAHVFVAANPLLAPLVARGLDQSGLERRGEVVRLVRTFRGGDRPKGAEDQYQMVSTMPRSCWEPWELYRKPLGCRTVAENLAKWATGGLRRVSPKTPFLDVIHSNTTPDRERALAPHPSVKPQHFLRQLVRASLPLGEGIVLDPFAGAGTTLAACEYIGVAGIGTESDPTYFEMACSALPQLASMRASNDSRQSLLPGL